VCEGLAERCASGGNLDFIPQTERCGHLEQVAATRVATCKAINDQVRRCMDEVPAAQGTVDLDNFTRAIKKDHASASLRARRAFQLDTIGRALGPVADAIYDVYDRLYSTQAERRTAEKQARNWQEAHDQLAHMLECSGKSVEDIKAELKTCMIDAIKTKRLAHRLQDSEAAGKKFAEHIQAELNEKDAEIARLQHKLDGSTNDASLTQDLIKASIAAHTAGRAPKRLLKEVERLDINAVKQSPKRACKGRSC
jgi:hypothetical protein